MPRVNLRWNAHQQRTQATRAEGTDSAGPRATADAITRTAHDEPHSRSGQLQLAGGQRRLAGSRAPACPRAHLQLVHIHGHPRVHPPRLQRGPHLDARGQKVWLLAAGADSCHRHQAALLVRAAGDARRCLAPSLVRPTLCRGVHALEATVASGLPFLVPAWARNHAVRSPGLLAAGAPATDADARAQRHDRAALRRRGAQTKTRRDCARRALEHLAR